MVKFNIYFFQRKLNTEHVLPPVSALALNSPSYVLGSKLVTASLPLHFIAALSYALIT